MIEWLSVGDRTLCIFGPIFFAAYIIFIAYNAYKDKK